MKFIKCIDANDLALQVAKEIKKTILKGTVNLGLATGSSPLDTYKKLIEMYKNEEINFSEVSTFNLDEYVNLDEKYHENSYREFMNENLFNHININKSNTYFPCVWNEKNDLTKQDYSEYDDLIQESGGLDLLILGLGNNGHIGFNEPGTCTSSKTRLVKLDQSTIQANSRFFKSIEDVPQYAVSMGLSTILSAEKIILIVLGSSKKEVLNSLMNTTTFDPHLPASALIEHFDVTVYYIEE